MTIAEVGNIIEFQDGLRGRVEKINELVNQINKRVE